MGVLENILLAGEHLRKFDEQIEKITPRGSKTFYYATLNSLTCSLLHEIFTGVYNDTIKYGNISHIVLMVSGTKPLGNYSKVCS